MKYLNKDKQEKSVWNIGICIGNERLKDANGKKIHSTQKPEILLEKIILSSSKERDLILDPFFGTGTTGAVAKKFNRHFIGIEQNEFYIKTAHSRIMQVNSISNEITQAAFEIKPPKVSLKELLKAKLLEKNEKFYNKSGQFICHLYNDEKVKDKTDILSIHQMSAKHLNKKTDHNGWSYFYIMRNNKLISIDSLRYECDKGFTNA